MMRTQHAASLQDRVFVGTQHVVSILSLQVGLLTLLLLLGLGSTTAAQAQSATTPTPTPSPISTPGALTLFHDDFNTRVDRWRVFDLGDKARLDYNVLDGDLQLIATTPGYTLWTVPDSDLALDQVTISLQADWVNGASDAQFGLIFDYHSDNDMLLATVTRTGQLRVGRFGFGVWKDTAPLQQLTLPGAPINETNAPNEAVLPFTIQASITGTGATRQLTVVVNGQAAAPVTLMNFKAGGFGLFAQNGTSGTISVALHHFQINTVNKTP